MKFLILLLLLSCGRKSSSNEVMSLSALNSKFGIPGIAGALFKDQGYSAMEAYGVKKAGENVSLEIKDKFHLGSCTKAMTSTLAALFVDAGKLSWTSTMAELLPGMEIHPSYLAMTFETLLVHRAGFPVEDPVVNEVRAMEPAEGRKVIASKLLKNAPLHAPGTKYTYSNYNYIVAGFILENLGASAWETLIQKNIFEPLDMKTCGFGVTSILNEVSPTEPWGHIKRNGIPVPRHFDNPPAFGPSSTAHCSIEDWGKFLKLHLDGFNEQSNFISSSSFQKLYSVHPSKDSSYTYGGWYLLPRSWAGGPTLSHAGSNTLNYAKVWIAPKRNAFIVSTANIGGDEAFLGTDSFIQQLISLYLH